MVLAVINLSGAGTNEITAGGDINLAAVADGANIAELQKYRESITLAGVALDAGGTSLLDINLDGAGDRSEDLYLNRRHCGRSADLRRTKCG